MSFYLIFLLFYLDHNAQNLNIVIIIFKICEVTAPFSKEESAQYFYLTTVRS